METGVVGAFLFTLCPYIIALMLTKKRKRCFKVRPVNRTRGLTGNFKYYERIKTLDKEQFIYKY